MTRPKQSRNRPLDIIIGKGILATEAILSEVRQRIASKAARLRNLANRPLAAASLFQEIEQAEPIIAEALFSTDVAAWVQAIREAVQGLPPWAIKGFLERGGASYIPGFGGQNPPPSVYSAVLADLPRKPIIRFPLIENAIESLERRNIVTRDVFDQLAAEERARSFTIAREMREDVIDRVRTVLAANLRQGASFQDFKTAISGELESSFIGPWHVETVFRTNAQAAFADGGRTIESDPIVDEVFPYKEWLAIHDARVRNDHLLLESLGLSGTNVYRRDDPFWRVYDVPLDYNCRCSTNLLTIEQAAERGVKEAQRWLRTGVRPPLDSRLPHIPFEPNPNFVRGRRVAA